MDELGGDGCFSTPTHSTDHHPDVGGLIQCCVCCIAHETQETNLQTEKARIGKKFSKKKYKN
jgi:hypothetical protein